MHDHDDRELERALLINAATLLALAEELVRDAEFVARLKALKERQEALLKELDEAQP
jgi:hypothetical protein